MQNGEDVKKALNKAAAYGKDIDLNRFDEGTRDPKQIENIEDSNEFKEVMTRVGVTNNEDRSGTIVFIDNGMSHCSNKEQEGVEMLSTQAAFKKYDWVKDYMWKSMDPMKDKYTAKTYLEDSDGYFIRVKQNYHAKYPVQTCMLLNKNKSIQNLHNIIIMEEGSSLEIITGCSTTHHSDDALHVGVSEIYIHDNAKLQFSMIHSWGKETGVRPRTATIMGKNSSYTNNYILLNPVGSLQSYPVANLNGENATCAFNTICLAEKGSNVDTGGMAILNAKNTNAQLMSRSITKGGSMIARGKLIGNASGAKAHLECRSLILEDGGTTLAIPELEAHVADVEMTHEAAVGKIARDQIEYLMSRGLTEDDAIGMIVKGFLAGSIEGLPDSLKKEIDEAIAKANLGS
ncbi:MAG: SufD family Fe-S cluster assembly protein [Candidatus Methanogranum gryphiswaldense]|nr:MAG: SufD family Fe-S cluster assembly protein [Candidatus Methanogranum sp. U3.2.1]